MAAARHRQHAAQELAFLRAVRIAVPAALDNQAASGFEKHEAALHKKISA